MEDFAGKVVIITGASGGIGQEVVRGFRDNEAIVCGIHNKNSVDISGVKTIKADLSRSDQCEEAVRECLRAYGRIDILINAAAITRDNFIEKLSDEDWGWVIASNLNSTFFMTRSVLPVMKKQCSGHIVNIGSIVSETGGMGCANYIASKAAIVGLTRATAKETARHEIYVNALVLGYIDAGLGRKLKPEIREKIEKMIPLGRFGDPQEVVRAIYFLATTKYMTGSTLRLGGGL